MNSREFPVSRFGFLSDFGNSAFGLEDYPCLISVSSVAPIESKKEGESWDSPSPNCLSATDENYFVGE